MPSESKNIIFKALQKGKLFPS